MANALPVPQPPSYQASCAGVPAAAVKVTIVPLHTALSSAAREVGAAGRGFTVIVTEAQADSPQTVPVLVTQYVVGVAVKGVTVKLVVLVETKPVLQPVL